MIAICNVIYGAPFVELWDQVCLPSELSPSNVKALNSRGRARYVLYTDDETLELLEACIKRRKLREFFDVNVHVFEMGSGHTGMTRSHQHCIAHYKHVVEGIIFSSADDIYHEGYYGEVMEQAVAKDKACITFAVRISLSCLQDVSDEFRKQGEMTYRRAVWFLHEFMHPLHQDQIIGQRRIRSKHPAVLFEYEQEVLTMRGFHMHPMYVPSRFLHNAFSDTIDGEFVESIGRSPENYVVMSGLNAPFVLSLTPDIKYTELRSENYLYVKQVLKWVFRNTNSAHKDFYINHAFVTSLNENVTKENMYDFSPHLTALSRVMESMAVPKAKGKLGLRRYAQPVIPAIRGLTYYWSYEYLREKMRIVRRQPPAAVAAESNGNGEGHG